MSAVSEYQGRIGKVFAPNPRGVVGIVDELLNMVCEQGCSLDWKRGRCCIKALHAPGTATAEICMQKSIFRALLARIAALANERSPNSVSPYGGEGEVAVLSGSEMLLHVAFENRSGRQQLVIRPSS